MAGGRGGGVFFCRAGRLRGCKITTVCVTKAVSLGVG